MLGDAHRADAGPTAAVRDGEGLVQVQVRDVAAELAGLREPDQRIEVRAVDVDLPAGRVDLGADLAHVALEDAVRGRVGDHDRRHRVTVLGQLRVEVGQVDGAIVGVGHGHDLEARQRRRRRVGAVGRRRDEHDVALPVAVRHVEPADGQQPGELALRSGVGLHRDLGVTGDPRQAVLQVGDELQPPGGLVLGRHRVDAGEFRPRDRLHGHRGVELHGARAQRDHGAVQRQVAVGQAPQVAHHLRLGADGVEDRVGQDVVGPQQIRQGPGIKGLLCDGARHLVARRVVHGGAAGDGRDQRGDVGVGGRFADGDAHDVIGDAPQIEPGLHCGGEDDVGAGAHRVGAAGDVDGQGVEEGGVDRLEPGVAKQIGQGAGAGVDGRGDFAQARGPVPHGVEAGDDGQQRLGGADVRRRAVAADVLLAGLQGQAVGGGAVGVDGHADQAAGQLALERLGAGHEGGVRAAEEQRHAETLRRTDGDVGTERPRRGDEHLRQQIARHRDQAAGGLRRGDGGGQVADLAGGAGVGQDDADQRRRLSSGCPVSCRFGRGSSLISTGGDGG